MLVRSISLFLVLSIYVNIVSASDWPQFMNVAERSGYAGDEVIPEKIGLVAQVKLDDAITTAPAIISFLGQALDKQSGRTICIEPATGKIIWENSEHYGASSEITGKDGLLFTGGYGTPFTCLSASDGSLVWKTPFKVYLRRSPTMGGDYVITRGYGGPARVFDIKTGKEIKKKGKKFYRIGTQSHACGPVRVINDSMVLAHSVAHIQLEDLDTGETIWKSERGFAPRMCAPVGFGNGRFFVNPQCSGIVYCFETESRR